MESVSVSPDGKLIAVDFVKGESSFIYTIDVATGVAKRLTNAKDGEELSPAFLADGSRIAYTYWPPIMGSPELVIVNVDGSDAHPWPPWRGNDFGPVFSPDNKTIVFGSAGYYGSYSPIAQSHSHAWTFYAADFDGKNMRQLTNETFYNASAPSVSPDGRSIAVVTEGVDTPSQIAIYSLDHAGQQTLSLRPHVPKEADHKNPIFNCPNYMPDGKSILFMAASNGKHGFDYDVYRVDLGTGSLERLTNGNGYATSLSVSSDGKTAVFLKWRSDWHSTPVKSELYLLDIESHKLTPLRISGLN